jgi:hypothetical protein
MVILTCTHYGVIQLQTDISGGERRLVLLRRLQQDFLTSSANRSTMKGLPLPSSFVKQHDFSYAI